MRLLVVILGMLTLALGVGSRFWPTVELAFVNGNQHHSRERVLWLANIQEGDPLLWINRWSLAALEADPWIARASVVRHFPDTVSISVSERTPKLTDGTVVWGEGGVELPGVSQEVIDSL